MTRVALSALDLATVGAGTTGADAIRASVGLAAHLEPLGYRRLWFAEHHLADGVASATPGVLTAAAAARTATIRVGSGAVALSATSPVQAAEQFGTIAALHPGRVDLGLGRAPSFPKPGEKKGASWWSRGGADQARDVDGLRIPAAPTDSRRGDALTERIERRRALLGVSREPEPFADEVARILALRDGTARDAAGERVSSPPAEGTDFEVWLLASSGGESAEVAGALGLPLAANYHVSPFSILDTVAAYRSAFRPGVLAEPYVLVSVDALVADTANEAERIGSGFADWVLSIRRTAGAAIVYPRAGEGTRWDDLADADQGLIRDRVESRFVGDPAAVVERLEALARVTGANELLVTTATHDPADKYRSFELLASRWHDGDGPGLGRAVARHEAGV